MHTKIFHALEPPVMEHLTADTFQHEAFLASAAISLKRIADALEKLTSGGIPTDLWNQVNCLAWEAGQQFGRGAQT